MELLFISFILGFSSEIPDYKKKNRQLMEESSFLTEHLVRQLVGCKVFPCRRINFICKASPTSESLSICGRIVELDVPFCEKYFEMDEKERTNYLYNLLYISIERFCSITQINFDMFNSIFDSIKSNDYTCFFDTGIKCKGTNNALVKISAKQTLNNAEFYADYYDNGKLVNRKPLFKSKPCIFDYDRFLGKLEWHDDDTIRLHSKDFSSFIDLTM